MSNFLKKANADCSNPHIGEGKAPKKMPQTVEDLAAQYAIEKEEGLREICLCTLPDNYWIFDGENEVCYKK